MPLTSTYRSIDNQKALKHAANGYAPDASASISPLMNIAPSHFAHNLYAAPLMRKRAPAAMHALLLRDRRRAVASAARHYI